MSHYVTPFLVLNLGSEMIFVIAQRLQAQNIPHERATLVLEEIISVLISKSLIADLMKPQATYSHENVREIVEDVTQSSAMRLDPVSMGKLWDLITMVFKWQVSMSENLLGITLRHLILENRGDVSSTSHDEEVPANELQLFVNEMLGQRTINSDNTEANRNCFKLTISDENANRARQKKVVFDNIDVNINDNKLQDLMNDMTLNDDEEISFKDDLLDMIGGDEEK
ncbi:hypothetical protein NQ314_013013 [Rhamnusium bicolor]|uniref:Uncharacterized protein n=1 Tax=Rhamnusium bicolor TaxID=1586634 RepID=A0AAV8X937_9CUCU|nr:hypothetical protein NQ314_013013 [Rhamnusium bicolor]